MHPYIVVVSDPINHKKTLSIPCAESETAVLVQKNLQSLFPASTVSLQVSPIKTPAISIISTTNVMQEDDFAELEEELFNDVA
jgi:hypothetical protein